MIAVPLARKFGLCFCLLWSTVGLLASQIWSACMTGSNDYNAFVVSRLVAGIFAGAPLILGSQIILHVFFLHERGKAFHIIHVPFLLGVVLAPAIGGFIIFRSPWPIQFWWTVGLCGLTIILTLLFLDDTEYDRTESQTPGTLSEFDSILKRRIKTYFYASAPHSSVTLAECVSDSALLKF
jgi:MFS family permease